MQKEERKDAILVCNEHNKWMSVAVEVAKKALPVDVPVGAVLVKDGICIAQAHNQREQDNNPVGHAEILVLVQAAKQLQSWRLHGTVLYVTLEPCLMCASAIQQARVSQVVFGANDPVMGACGSKYNIRGTDTTFIENIMQDDCQTLLQTFFKQCR